jgi:hypothetical protein
MWVGLGNWVDIVLKNENPIKKNNWFRLKLDPNSINPLNIFIFIFTWKKKNIKCFGHKSSLVSKIDTRQPLYKKTKHVKVTI